MKYQFWQEFMVRTHLVCWIKETTREEEERDKIFLFILPFSVIPNFGDSTNKKLVGSISELRLLSNWQIYTIFCRMSCKSVDHCLLYRIDEKTDLKLCNRVCEFYIPEAQACYISIRVLWQLLLEITNLSNGRTDLKPASYNVVYWSSSHPRTMNWIVSN